MDKVTVKIGVALCAGFVSLQKIQKLLPFLLGHGCISIPLLLTEHHRLTVDLQIFHGFFPNGFHFSFPLSLLFRLLAHGFFTDEEAVKYPIKNQLLFTGLGINCAQYLTDGTSIFKTDFNQNPAGISSFLGTDVQSLQAQHSGKSREFFQIDLLIIHGDALRYGSIRRNGHRCRRSRTLRKYLRGSLI